MRLDIDRARAETPACEEVLHFNNAGASLMPTPVYRAVVDHLELERRIGGYEAEQAARARIQGFYDGLATLLNCSRDEIAYVENATRAWDMAFYSIDFQPGDRVLTARSEYVSNYLAYLQMERRRGIVVEPVPDDDTGQLCVSALEQMMDEKVRLISITHVPTHGGLVNPAEAVGAVARRHGVLYLLDACQSVGQLRMDVERIGCDLLSGTGRKYLRGPRGTGFLYVRRRAMDRLDPQFIDLRSATWTAPQRYELRPDAVRFENWESFVAGRVGLACAVDYALELGVAAIEERVVALAATLRARLGEIPGVAVHDLGARRCGIVTLTKEGETPRELCTRLRGLGMNTSTSTVQSAQLDLPRRGLSGLLRASVHYFNTEEEIERFCAAVAAKS